MIIETSTHVFEMSTVPNGRNECTVVVQILSGRMSDEEAQVFAEAIAEELGKVNAERARLRRRFGNDL